MFWTLGVELYAQVRTEYFQRSLQRSSSETTKIKGALSLEITIQFLSRTY